MIIMALFWDLLISLLPKVEIYNPGINVLFSAGIPTLVLAAASLDVVICISFFGVFLGLTFSDGEHLRI